MSEVLDRLRANAAEQARLLTILAMWEKVQDQGIDPESVRAFSFDPALMDFADRRAAQIKSRWSGGVGSNANPFNFPLVTNAEGHQVFVPNRYNVCILKNGNRIKLDPMIESP